MRSIFLRASILRVLFIRPLLLGSIPVGFASIGSPTFAQPEPIPSHVEAYDVDSGNWDNPTDQAVLVFESTVSLTTLQGGSYAWSRIFFSEVSLPAGSAVRITSLEDGASQVLDAVDLEQWGHGSAILNGSIVKLELIAGPFTYNNAFQVREIIVGDLLDASEKAPDSRETRDLCGNDDRVSSDEKPVGRLDIFTIDSLNVRRTIVGTGFITNRKSRIPPAPDQVGEQKCHLTAGHNFILVNPTGPGERVESVIMSFGPLSSGNPDDSCAPVAALPEKQFAAVLPAVADTTMLDGPGCRKDWAVYDCRPNPDTRKTTFAEQSAYYVVETDSATVAVSTLVRVTGYGEDRNGDMTDDNRACQRLCHRGGRHLSQQTNSAATVPENHALRLHHKADTCGGNSGSPIIRNSDHRVIGIHTSNGCSDAVEGCGGIASNHGTKTSWRPLVAALDSCTAPPPTAVTGLFALDVVAGEDWIEIRWGVRTRDEYQGFNVLRSEGGRAFERRNAAVIPSAADYFPATFSWTDETAREEVGYSYRIEVIKADGESEIWDDTITARVLGRAPFDFALRVTGPNPFHAEEGTSFEYAVPRSGAMVSISVCDLSGRRISTLVEGRLEAGTRSGAWRMPRPDHLASGVYFLRMESGDFTAAERLVLLK